MTETHKELTMSHPTYYRLGLGVALTTALFLVLGIGALGIIGEGGRPDRIYAAVLGVLAVGTVLARLHPLGMALALMATALTQAVVTATALLAGLHDTAGASVVDMLGITAMYAVLFSVSGWLFWRAAKPHVAVSVGGPA
jgi:hypothetical protein